jgi:hypothetical protein
MTAAADPALSPWHQEQNFMSKEQKTKKENKKKPLMTPKEKKAAKKTKKESRGLFG